MYPPLQATWNDFDNTFDPTILYKRDDQFTTNEGNSCATDSVIAMAVCMGAGTRIGDSVSMDDYWKLEGHEQSFRQLLAVAWGKISLEKKNVCRDLLRQDFANELKGAFRDDGQIDVQELVAASFSGFPTCSFTTCEAIACCDKIPHILPDTTPKKFTHRSCLMVPWRPEKSIAKWIQIYFKEKDETVRSKYSNLPPCLNGAGCSGKAGIPTVVADRLPGNLLVSPFANGDGKVRFNDVVEELDEDILVKHFVDKGETLKCRRYFLQGIVLMRDPPKSEGSIGHFWVRWKRIGSDSDSKPRIIDIDGLHPEGRVKEVRGGWGAGLKKYGKTVLIRVLVYTAQDIGT